MKYPYHLKLPLKYFLPNKYKSTKALNVNNFLKSNWPRSGGILTHAIVHKMATALSSICLLAKGLGKSWNLEAGAGTVKVGMWVLEMLFSYSGKTWKQSLEAGDSV